METDYANLEFLIKKFIIPIDDYKLARGDFYTKNEKLKGAVILYCDECIKSNGYSYLINIESANADATRLAQKQVAKLFKIRVTELAVLIQIYNDDEAERYMLYQELVSLLSIWLLSPHLDDYCRIYNLLHLAIKHKYLF